MTHRGSTPAIISEAGVAINTKISVDRAAETTGTRQEKSRKGMDLRIISLIVAVPLTKKIPLRNDGDVQFFCFDICVICG
jgi:hypothetical protein